MTISVVRGVKMWQDFCGNRPISTSSVKEILLREGDYPKVLLSTRFKPFYVRKILFCILPITVILP
jgi:hypothetical protein